jgi:hypothetical protein
MRLHRVRLLPLLAWSMLVLAVACEDEEGPIGPLQGLAPNFSLLDVNPNSPSSGQTVSPRHQLQKVSAWYFGHAT